MSMRDLTDETTRRACGARCLIEYRDEWEARAEADVWDGFLVGTLPADPIGQTIQRHFDRVRAVTMSRSNE